MNYPVIYERIDDDDFEAGYFYAHLPTLGLTTHGKGIDGAKEAALDLLKLWTNDTEHKKTNEFMFATLEV